MIRVLIEIAKFLLRWFIIAVLGLGGVHFMLAPWRAA